MTGRRSEYFVNGVDYSWHRDPELTKAVKQFHDRYAREPKADIKDAKRLHQLYTDELQRLLQAHGVCRRLEYTGSAYEGVKVRRTDDDSDLEFDIMVILRCGTELQVEPTGKPGYVKLLLQAQNTGEQHANELISKAVNKNNLLSADRLADRFMGELKRILQQCQQEACSGDNNELTDDQDDPAWRLEQLRQINDRIKLRRHGPAIQMDVMHLRDTLDDSQRRSSSDVIEEESPSKLFYSVDMVPTIQISDRDGKDHYYVAKPIKGASNLQIAWRRSFSVKEKERLTTIDEDNGCRKQVLRVLKVIRHRDASLAMLTSYHLKTVIFRKTDELSDPVQWKSDCLGQRLMDVIGQMEMELDKGVMPHYYLPDINLLDGKRQQAVVNLRNRLKNLINSQRKVMKLLESKK